VPTGTLKDAAINFLTMVVAGDVRGAYERHVAAGFRHHNPYFAGDVDSLRKGMEEDESRNPGKTLGIHLALQEGNHVAVHSRLRRAADDPGFAVVHIFRFENDRIAELWDVVQTVPDEIVNRNGMF
jgi:predicted SnoaL-like aldol condensation-catalyzing enzyme